MLTLAKSPCPKAKPSRRMGNFTSQEPTMFCTLKSVNVAGKPTFWMILAYCANQQIQAGQRLAFSKLSLLTAKITVSDPQKSEGHIHLPCSGPGVVLTFGTSANLQQCMHASIHGGTWKWGRYVLTGY